MGYDGPKKNPGGMGLEIQGWNEAQENLKIIQDF